MKKLIFISAICIGMWGTQAMANCDWYNKYTCNYQPNYSIPEMPTTTTPRYENYWERDPWYENPFQRPGPQPRGSVVEGCYQRCYTSTPPNTSSRNMCLRNCAGGW